jgi:hypothetical protein
MRLIFVFPVYHHNISDLTMLDDNIWWCIAAWGGYGQDTFECAMDMESASSHDIVLEVS